MPPIENTAGELANQGLGGETEVLEPVTPETPETPEPENREETPPKRMSVRESIQDAIAKASRPQGEQEQQKPPKAGAAVPGQKAGKEGSTTAAQTPGQTEAPVPDAWKSKEWKPLWDAMSPQVRAAITKRETDMANGVQQLRSRYTELDNVIAPNRDRIRQFGFTEPQAIDQMFKWQAALAGPDKVRAFVALMQSHGLDPAAFAAAVMQANGASPPPNNGAGNGAGAIHPEVKQALDAINQKLGIFEQNTAKQTQDAAAQTVNAWRKDKPHVTDSVMKLMGRLIQSGAVQPSENDPFALDAAYSMAIYADPETRALVTADEQKKAAEARKAQVDKARRAGASMRTGAPVPPANGGAQQRDTRNETARQSITRALAELRGS